LYEYIKESTSAGKTSYTGVVGTSNPFSLLYGSSGKIGIFCSEGCVFYTKGQYENAIKSFRSALEANTNNGPAEPEVLKFNDFLIYFFLHFDSFI